MDTVQLSRDTVVIDVENVKKKFHSYQDKASSLKERFIHPSRAKHSDVMVLNGISFQVNRGEAVGIIGKNGCGKSTTLKLLTRILYPNEGTVTMTGRVSSLIELGAGFHPDMTGRENIYTNASIFGITRKEIDRRLNDIIRFSELEDYIDNPVRTYSSGMYMRLAFAVAINVDADILLIDEILAVGDSAFQRKCFERLKEIKANGTTIVIVSHSMDQLYQICDRLIWLENGLIREAGLPRVVGEAYLAEMEDRRLNRIDTEELLELKELEERLRNKQNELQLAQNGQEFANSKEKKELQAQLAKIKEKKRELECNGTLHTLCALYQPGARRKMSGEIQYTKVRLLDAAGKETNQLITGQNYQLCLSYRTETEMDHVRFSMGITRVDGIYTYGTYMESEVKIPLEGTLKMDFQNALLKGSYVLDLWIEPFEGEAFDSIYSLMRIDVDTPIYDERGLLTMEHRWSMETMAED